MVNLPMPEKQSSIFLFEAKALDTELTISLTHLSTVSRSKGLSNDIDEKLRGSTGMDPTK